MCSIISYSWAFSSCFEKSSEMNSGFFFAFVTSCDTLALLILNSLATSVWLSILIMTL